MLTTNDTFSITKLRQNASDIIRQVNRERRPVYVFKRSQPRAVILSVDHFNMLEETYQNYLDAMELHSVTQKELDQAQDWSEVKRELNLQ